MFEQITFCLILTNQNTAKMISTVLLNMGIISFIAENVDSVENILDNNKVDFLFIDFDFANNISFDLLDKIKKNENFSSLFIIGTSINTNEKFIKNIQKYYLLSYLLKPLSQEIVKEKIENIIYKIKNHFPERKHVRVEPAEDELMRISFQLKNQKFISAKVINISLGGLAMEMFTNYDSEDIQTEYLIEHVQFVAGNKEVEVDGKIVFKKNKLLSLKFTHFYKNSHEYLLRYIMKKLSV